MGRMCVSQGSGLYFSFWAWSSKHWKLGLGCIIWRSFLVFHWNAVCYLALLPIRFWELSSSANLDINLPAQECSSFWTQRHPPSWCFKWPVRPSSCDNTALPSPGRLLHLHGTLGLFPGLWRASGMYQHGACWEMDGSERSEGRVRLCWECLATSLGKARKSLNNRQEQEQAWSDL